MSVQLLSRWLIWLAAALSCATPASALTPQQARALVVGETETRIATLNELLEGADEKTVTLIQALSDDAVKFSANAVYLMNDGKARDPVTGAELDAARGRRRRHQQQPDAQRARRGAGIDQALRAGCRSARRSGQDAAGRARRSQAAVDREGLCGRDGGFDQAFARPLALGHAARQCRQGQAPGGRDGTGRERHAGHQDAADRAAEGGRRSRRAGRDRRGR